MKSRSESLLPVTRSNYRRQDGPPIHPLTILFILLIFFGLIAFSGFYLITAKNVTLVIEGVKQQVRTHQATVGGVIAELRLLIEPEDILTPSAETPIRAGLTITIDKAQPILIQADGQQNRVLTHLVQPLEILREAEIALGEFDTVEVNGVAVQSESYITPPQSISVIRAIKVSLNDAGRTKTLYSTSRTVGEILYEANIPLYLADKITPEPGTLISDGATIRIMRSIPIVVIADGRTLNTRTHGKTVSEALAEIGLAPVGLDYVEPEESANIEANSTIRLVRVVEEIEINQSTIDFNRVTQPDSSLPLGVTKVIQEGLLGVREERVYVRREDGVEISRSTPDVIILQAPRDEIIAVGGETIPTPDVTPTPFGNFK